MKLEVGMYVKTINGFHKISRINFKGTNWESYDCDLKENGNGGVVYIPVLKREILKASHNIIDLIEVGDYVNGVIVDDIFPKCEYAEQCIQLKGSKDYLYDIHIKSIVTKEQFESMSYKVDE